MGKWACFGRQDSPGKSNFSKKLRGIGTNGVNRTTENAGPEKCVDQFGNRSVSPKIRIFSVSLPFNVFFISVFTWSNVSYLEVS